MAGQRAVDVGLEHVDHLDADLHAGHPGRHCQREASAWNRDLGSGRRLHRAAFELAETFLEAVEKLGEVEVSLDLGLAQEKDRPLALGDLERRNSCLKT